MHTVKTCYATGCDDILSFVLNVKLYRINIVFTILQSETEVKTQCMEIIDMYDIPNDIASNKIKIPVEDPEETLIKMLENNIRTVETLPNKTNKQNSEEEDSDLVKIRKKILSQYAQVCYN